ncbi:uncharacterized protein MYCFIDRAFT_216963 [Pseudocercospora fijiensis CIRAD86]|uniref:Programmed cell death protein 2 C-terminal domain-containing protein n=1 Tax=Pseudocercospora fijiensis (strain CIRAD86) TaxID=383855 RepID=M3ALM3_PSEFD|nr:uncharacterized protein MYCFIDRAFT_216963 [Pseudocercospora fijiensis CIRAD86]EME78053.1 hypothetical protein MYCFIDRAFT_216963 [Pseudocercospora fijiensis CIRAD86]
MYLTTLLSSLLASAIIASAAVPGVKPYYYRLEGLIPRHELVKMMGPSKYLPRASTPEAGGGIPHSPPPKNPTGNEPGWSAIDKASGCPHKCCTADADGSCLAKGCVALLVPTAYRLPVGERSWGRFGKGGKKKIDDFQVHGGRRRKKIRMRGLWRQPSSEYRYSNRMSEIRFMTTVMADDDSDSSIGDDIETNVLLAYASKEPTSDDFSQLGGHPIWIDGKTAPDGALAKCKVCNSHMSLLLQLHADLPGHFPGHERKLYVWACRRKACRRKEGSVRGFRGTRQVKVDAAGGTAQEKTATQSAAPAKVQTGLGESLFGVAKSNTSTSTNPFASPSGNATLSNPFASASSLAAKPPQKPETSESLPQTFAEKAKISSPLDEPTPEPQPKGPKEPWPEKSAFPTAYPSYYLDADKEYIDPEPPSPAQSTQNIRVDDDADGSSSASNQELFESSMDKTFQKFADRLSQNPEQILRYEYAGHPLLYSRSDAVGKLLDPTHANEKVKTIAAGKIPACKNCGAERVFEMQLTPHAITELEAEEEGLDGMDWGTILFGVCSKDCQQKGVKDGEVGYVEEWVGVQWEELAEQK